jgi:hypothetical protein
VDLKAEYRLSLSPYNYVKNNPIFYVDLYGLQDTSKRPMPEVELPEGRIYAYRNSAKNSRPNKPEWGLILYGKNGRDGTNPYAWGPWLDWDPMEFLGFHWGKSRRYYEKPGKPTYVEMAKRTIKAAATDEDIIKDKAGNNHELIENNPVVKMYKEKSETKQDQENSGPTVYHIIEGKTVLGNYSIYIYRYDSVIYKVSSPKGDTSIYKWANESQLFR